MSRTIALGLLGLVLVTGRLLVTAFVALLIVQALVGMAIAPASCA